MEDIELPYIVVGDAFSMEYRAHDIEPSNENKRIRVFGTQLMDAIIEDVTLQNFNWSIGWYFGQGIKLIEKFPTREIELNKLMITFWRKMQIRYKQLTN